MSSSRRTSAGFASLAVELAKVAHHVNSPLQGLAIVISGVRHSAQSSRCWVVNKEWKIAIRLQYMINCSCKWGKPWSPAFNMRPSIKAVALCLLARFRPSRSRIGQGTSEPTNACINVNAALSAEKGSPPCRATPWKLISLNGTEAWSQVPVADVAGRFCLTFRALRSTRHVKRLIEAPGFSNHDKAVRMLATLQDADLQSARASTGVALLEYHPQQYSLALQAPPQQPSRVNIQKHLKPPLGLLQPTFRL